MSQPVSRILHPFEFAHHPSPEPEVKRAILARWASDSSARPCVPAPRVPPGAKRRMRAERALRSSGDLGLPHIRADGVGR
ncbi:hypothetical protein [Sphingomonas sp. NIBR02145]|uniref:hypothetical protein n=1 Tax=Sphingomonas sp. NIBR02145 TaxID=3014784 RepID=UPI0022B3F8CA|nr:hypothetical protein [Sphingomonas sp. NIBR02145]WHU02389.1 hypothetical protein O3305_19745 [Sphingomonas sp. NIBR02145]